MLTTIIYRSHLRDDAPLRALEDMVTAANLKNRRSDVTGILLFNGRHFFQLLEGPEEQVKEIYRCICNAYFKGNKPLIKDLPIKFKGTEFQLKVWNELLKIPYGSTISYKELGKIIFGEKNISSQAIGRAVSKNKLLVIVPCHRVIGSKGDLVGYAGGIDRKKYLLDHEK